MSDLLATTAGSLTEVRKPSILQRFAHGLGRFAHTSPMAAACLCFLLLLIVLALAADLVAPYDPLAADYAASRAAPSAAHPMGTDDLGRDVLSRVIYGTRVTLLVAFSSVFLGDTLGFIWGVLSAYLGGKLDLWSQRLLDILMSFPSLILALLLMVILGAGVHTVVIAIAVTRIPLSTRVVRSMALGTKEAPYVEAARLIGAGSLRIAARHIAPQCVASFLIVVSAHLGAAIFTEAALSFMGVGVPPPTPSWGNMLGSVLGSVFRPPWWLVIYPGMATTLTVMAANLFGDGVRDFLDPRLKVLQQ